MARSVINASTSRRRRVVLGTSPRQSPRVIHPAGSPEAIHVIRSYMAADERIKMRAARDALLEHADEIERRQPTLRGDGHRVSRARDSHELAEIDRAYDALTR